MPAARAVVRGIGYDAGAAHGAGVSPVEADSGTSAGGLRQGHDFRVLARIRDEWDAAIAALDRDDALSPGFVLMKSIWEDYARAGLIDRD